VENFSCSCPDLIIVWDNFKRNVYSKFGHNVSTGRQDVTAFENDNESPALEGEAAADTADASSKGNTPCLARKLHAKL
jgi:hypothetical protein